MHEFWAQGIEAWRSPSLRNLIDIAIVALLVYEVLRLVRGTRAVQMAVGLVLVALLFQLSSWLCLSTVQWLLRNVAVYLGFAIIILFQSEIRTALTHFGKTFHLPFRHARGWSTDYGQDWYDDVVLAATTLSSEKIGALLVFERDVGLKTLVESGIQLDARACPQLLTN